MKHMSVEEIKKAVKCLTCLTLKEDHRILSCRHSFCKKCIQSLHNNGIFFYLII